MSFSKRWAGLAIATSLAFSGAAFVAPLATASPAVAPMVATTYSSQATLAATWLASQTYGADGGAADAAIALAGEGSQLARAKALVQSLADAVAADPTGAWAVAGYDKAAKAAIAAQSVGMDPTNFGGVDLFAVIANRQNPSHWGDSLSAIVLHRAGRTVPADVQAALVSQQTYDNILAWNDPDGAGLVLSTYSFLTDPGTAAAKDRLVAWLDTKKVDNTHWRAWTAINSTAMVGSGYLDNGMDASAAQQWLAGQQTPSGAFPADTGGTDQDKMATTQALMFLANSSYLTAQAATPPPVTPAPTPTTTPTTHAPVDPANERVQCADDGGVWTIIQVAADVTHRDCVMNPATAYAAFASLATIQTKDTSYGPMICSIDGGQDCNAAFDGNYWGFYQSAPNLVWDYATAGPQDVKPAPGSYIALIWSDAAKPLQVLTGDGAVPVVTPTPAPTSSKPKLANTGSR